MIRRTAFALAFLFLCSCEDRGPVARAEALRGCITAAAYAEGAQARSIMVDSCMARRGYTPARDAALCRSVRHAWAEAGCYAALP